MEPVRGGSRPSRRLKLSVAALMALASMLALSQWASAQIAVGEIKGSISPGGSQVNAPFHGYMVFMDTNAKAFSPVVTLPVSLCGHGKTSLTPVYEWAQSTGVFLAINGSFFDPETEYKPGDCRQAFGPVRSNYLDLAPSIKRPDDKGNPALLFGSNGAPRIVMAMPGDVKASRSVVGAQWEGSPIDHQNGSLLIENGILKGDTALPEATTAAARTAVGLTSGGILIIIAVEKNLPDSEGITLPNLAALLQAFGAFNAINLDGGGSTTMTYFPQPGLPMRETPALYQAMKSAQVNGPVSYTFTQRDPRIAFASRPSDVVSINDAAPKSTEYRPVAIQLGFVVASWAGQKDGRRARRPTTPRR